MSNIAITGGATGTGVFSLVAPSTNTNRTLTLPDATGTVLSTASTSVVTPAMLTQPLTLGTAVASTSGTSIDFNSIPSWVKRVTVMFSGVSTNGSSIVQIQIGSGSVSTSGYKSTASFGASPGQFGYTTTGFIINTSYTSSSFTNSGMYVFTLIGSNTWVGSGTNGGDSVGLIGYACAGSSPALAGTLDRVRITTVNGTDAFDAGFINILYE